MSQIPPEKGYRYSEPQEEEFEARCLHRLQEDLGIDQDGAEIILQMRRQMIALQARLRQLEDELSIRQAGRSARLARYRHTYIETTWYEEPGRKE